MKKLISVFGIIGLIQSAQAEEKWSGNEIRALNQCYGSFKEYTMDRAVNFRTKSGKSFFLVENGSNGFYVYPEIGKPFEVLLPHPNARKKVKYKMVMYSRDKKKRLYKSILLYATNGKRGQFRWLEKSTKRVSKRVVYKEDQKNRKGFYLFNLNLEGRKRVASKRSPSSAEIHGVFERALAVAMKRSNGYYPNDLYYQDFVDPCEGVNESLISLIINYKNEFNGPEPIFEWVSADY